MDKRILTSMLAFLLAVVPLAGCRRAAIGGSSAAPEDVEVVAVVRSEVPGLLRQFHAGDTVKSKESGSLIGTIASVSSTPTLVAVPTAEGRLVEAPSPNQNDITVRIKGRAVMTPTGYTFDGFHLYVTDAVKLMSPYVLFDASVLSIRKAGT